MFKGRVVSYIVTADGSNISEGSGSQVTEVSGMVSSGGAVNGRSGVKSHAFNGRNHHQNQQHSNHTSYNNQQHGSRSYGNVPFMPMNRLSSHRPDHDFDDSTTCTESTISSRCSRRGRGYGGRCDHDCDCNDSSSMATTDNDSTSYVDSDDEDDDDIDVDESASRISTTTADTSVSRIIDSRRRRRRMRRMMPGLSNASSVSSTITDSTLSMNVITVTLNMESPDAFLGISLVGLMPGDKTGGGIYVNSIMEGGVVAIDGRIETQDKILQVNDVNLECITNDEAVALLRDVAQRHETIKLVVLKAWKEESPRFAIPNSEPVRPIDPGAWVAHTEAARAAGEYPIRPPSSATLTSNSSSIQSSVTDSERLLTMDKQILNLDTVDMLTITKSMAAYDSGLDIKERDWLKIKIPDAFLGSDVVDWLFSHVHGFHERRDAKKYASQMMKQGFIRHTLSKNSFSEQCYYVFGDMINLADAVNRLRLAEEEDCDSSDRDTLITVRDGGRATSGGSNPGSPWHQQRHQVAPANYTDPQPGHGFLPWGADSVHYGTIFGPNAGSGNGIGSQHQSNSRSGGSSCSDAERSQLSLPLPLSISSFKPQLMSSFGGNHLPAVSAAMHHVYQNDVSQNQYSEPNYATAVLSNDSSKSSSRSNGIREEIGS